MCVKCGAAIDGNDGPFVTCRNCRLPMQHDGGGCHHWDGVTDRKGLESY